MKKNKNNKNNSNRILFGVFLFSLATLMLLAVSLLGKNQKVKEIQSSSGTVSKVETKNNPKNKVSGSSEFVVLSGSVISRNGNLVEISFKDNSQKERKAKIDLQKEPYPEIVVGKKAAVTLTAPMTADEIEKQTVSANRVDLVEEGIVE
jgi:hypothetical protein